LDLLSANVVVHRSGNNKICERPNPEMCVMADSIAPAATTESPRPLYERALAIYEKALGAEHPDTKTIRENLSRLGKGAKTKAIRNESYLIAISYTKSLKL
jgi:hypothetical protein